MSQHREIFESKGKRFIIRNATPEDVQAIYVFMDHVDRETTFLAREPGEFELAYPPEKEAAFLKHNAESEDCSFLVAEAENGELAGTCGIQWSSDRQRFRHRAEIGISIRQAYWRMGLGRKLLNTQFDWCRQRGITKLNLEVDTLNSRAIGLYLATGFVIEGTLYRESKMADGSYRNFYSMGKFLD